MGVVQVRMPGKIMLAGEYAVLRGGACIACALEPHLEVSCAPHEGYRLTSTLWDTPQVFSLPQLEALPEDCEPFAQVVQEAERRWLLGGADIEVRSGLEVKAGLGSSSALRGCVLAALAHLRIEGTPRPSVPISSQENLIQAVTRLQRVTQGAASGYDIATQVHGGLLWMIPETGDIRALAADPVRFETFFDVWTGGKGAPTGPTMYDTLAWLDQEDLWPDLLTHSQAIVDGLVDFFAGKMSVADLLKEMGRYRQFFADSPHFPTSVAAELEALPGLDASWSYKTTGAGGEDSLLVLGHPEARKSAGACLQRLGWYRLPGKWGVAGIEIKKGDLWHPMFT